MENEVQSNVSPIQRESQIPTSSPVIMTWPRLLLVLFSTLGMVSLSLWIGIQIGERRILVMPEASDPITTQETEPVSTTSGIASNETTVQPGDSVEWLSYTHTKLPDTPTWKIPWKGFTIYYPSDWKIDVDRREDGDGSGPSFGLTLTKDNGDYFEIMQGAGGYGACLFPDDPEYETFDGMGMFFQTYDEIRKSNGIIWRLGDSSYPNELWTHELCENPGGQGSGYSFVGSTIIGGTKIKITTPESKAELIEVLKRIEITD